MLQNRQTGLEQSQRELQALKTELARVEHRLPESDAELDTIDRESTDRERHRLALDKAYREAHDRFREKQEEQLALRRRLREESDVCTQLHQAAQAVGERPPNVRLDTARVEAELTALHLLREELRITHLDATQVKRQEQLLRELEDELEHGRDHVGLLDTDIKQRHKELGKNLRQMLSHLTRGMNHLLNPVFASVHLTVENLLSPEDSGFLIRLERRESEELDLDMLSGGEKVLVVEALIFAFHLLVNSPLHAIDEFTQRLDIDFKSQAMQMAFLAVQEATQQCPGPLAPQFLIFCPDTLGVQFTPNAAFRQIVLGGLETEDEANPNGDEPPQGKKK